MNLKTEANLRCLDPEFIIPISRKSTEHFKTGTWSRLRPMFLEKTSPCRAVCPIGNNIPRALYRAAQEDYDGALSAFLEESPLPGVCGRVCYHPCQTPCNRVELDGAVNIKALERAAATLGSAEPLPLTDSGQTSKKGLFAGGDLTPARASVVDAMASGKRAALAIHMALIRVEDQKSLQGVSVGEGPAFSIEAFFNRPLNWDPHHVVLLDELDLITSAPMPPITVPHLDPAERTKSFEEVSQSLNADQVYKEANRCFFCGSCVGCDRCYIFCPEGAVIPPDHEGGAYQAHNDYCKGCGTCATVCVRGVLENKEGE